MEFDLSNPKIKNLVNIVSDPIVFKETLLKLSTEQQKYIIHFAEDWQKYIEQNPLLKFRKNNKPQLKFLNFDKPFQIFIGGNKGGKTATMTYKGVRIGLGKQPNFKRKPEVGKPLINWLCGETRDVLEQTPLEELTKWLRKDQWRLIRKGTIIDRVRVYVKREKRDDDSIYSDYIFKPYSGGVDIFESANVSGCIMCDEEMPRDIFDAIIPRMVAHGAWLMNALTPTHGITYMKDVLDGDGDYAGLKGANLVQSVQAKTEDNLANIDPSMYLAMIARLAVHDRNGRLLAEDGSIIEDPSKLLDPKYPKKPKLTPMGKIRLSGDFASVDGRVYRIYRSLNGESWHDAGIEELPNLDECVITAMSDYGRGDEFVFVLIAIDKNETHWCFAEIYEKNMETHEQALAIYELCEKHGVRPVITVADSQIKNNKASGGTILQDYETVTFPMGHEKEGQVILGHNFTLWHCSSKLKLNPPVARQGIGQKLDINPVTNKPFYRFIASKTPRLFKCLEYAEYQKNNPDKLKGLDDHGEAALRYYNRANITYANWHKVFEEDARKDVRRKYSAVKQPKYQGFTVEDLQ